MGAAGGLDGDGGETEGALFGVRGRGGLLPFHLIDALYHQEYSKSDDEKANNRVNKNPKIEGNGPGGFGRGQGGVRAGGFGAFLQGDE